MVGNVVALANVICICVSSRFYLFIYFTNPIFIFPSQLQEREMDMILCFERRMPKINDEIIIPSCGYYKKQHVWKAYKGSSMKVCLKVLH